MHVRKTNAGGVKGCKILNKIKFIPPQMTENHHLWRNKADFMQESWIAGTEQSVEMEMEVEFRSLHTFENAIVCLESVGVALIVLLLTVEELTVELTDVFSF